MTYTTQEFRGVKLVEKRGGADVVFVFHILTRDDDGAVIEAKEKEISLADYIDARTR